MLILKLQNLANIIFKHNAMLEYSKTTIGYQFTRILLSRIMEIWFVYVQVHLNILYPSSRLFLRLYYMLVILNIQTEYPIGTSSYEGMSVRGYISGA